MSFSHLDSFERPRMVDVGDKPASHRIARAEGFIQLHEDTVAKIKGNQIRKGNVLVTAELAGVMAAKHTQNLIPLCHTLNLTKVHVEATLESDGVRIVSDVRCTGQTGVEMEALTAVSVALLTIYDMCKAVDKNMELRQVRLVEKIKTPC
jgi:cyclic pyranopterin phosphate synthase